jgi:hypothetical protein
LPFAVREVKVIVAVFEFRVGVDTVTVAYGPLYPEMAGFPTVRL